MKTFGDTPEAWTSLHQITPALPLPCSTVFRVLKVRPTDLQRQWLPGGAQSKQERGLAVKALEFLYQAPEWICLYMKLGERWA